MLVPHSHMLELYRRMKHAASSSKVENIVRLHVVKDGTHNETWMQGGREYWIAIQKFIEEVLAEERHGGGVPGGNTTSGVAGPFQRKASSSLTSMSVSSTSADDGKACGDGSSASALDVGMGFDGDDAAIMISSVGNFIGMAREATRSVAGGGRSLGAASSGGAKPYKKID